MEPNCRLRGSERFALFAILWMIRNCARGAAGRVNVEREMAAALSPVAMRLALGAVTEVMRLLTAAEGPLHIHAVPCRAVSPDEQRVILVCRAIRAGNCEIAQAVAGELVGDAQAQALVGHMHTLYVVLCEGADSPPVHVRPQPRSLSLH